MAAYSVALSPRAVAQALRIGAWWRKHRRAAPQLFLLELDAALEHLRAHPALGRRVRSRAVRDARVLLLERTGYWGFYQVRETAREVLIAHIRHARRRGEVR